MTSTINITTDTPVAVIDIEGVIGVPEQLQFDNDDERVATFERFSESLANIKKINAKHVIVNIRSTGGNVNDALLIFDALKELDAVITTRCYGYVASAATIIAQAASDGQREISPNALYLIHRSESAAEGNSMSMAATVEMLNATDQRIANIYAARSGRSAKSFFDLMNQNNGKGRWLSANEALEAGLVDNIIISSTTNRISNQCDYGELLKLCSMFGLTPPPNSSPQTFADSALSYLKNIWTKLGNMFHGENHPSDTQISNKNSKPQTSVNKHITHDNLNQSNNPTDSVKTPENKAVTIAIRRNAQAEAYQTTTDNIEDPSIEERIPTPNEQAYLQDALNIKNRI